MNVQQHVKVARTAAVTIAVRRVNPRVGTAHTYTLNGTLMHDVLVDGHWITVSASKPL